MKAAMTGASLRTRASWYAADTARTSSTVTASRPSLATDKFGGEVGLDLVDGDALLGHRVAFADGDRVVFERVEVDGDAERGADLVLAAVPAADRAGVVELH